MKKTALHFKIASWSCRHPGAFYALNILVLVCCIGFGILFSKNFSFIENGASEFSLASTSSEIPEMPDWKPVSDMDLPDGVKCRLYEREGTSITNCYALRDGKWVFEQSF